MTQKSPSRTKRQHLLSHSYQKAWADRSGDIAVVSKAKNVWYRGRPKTAFTKKNFLTYNDGVSLNDGLETAFGSVEATTMPIVREILQNQRADNDAREAAGALCAMHWARSISVRSIYDRSMATADDPIRLPPEVVVQSVGQHGTAPHSGELAAQLSHDAQNSNLLFAQLVQENYNRFLEEMIDQRHVQLVWIGPGTVSFLAADSPVVVSSASKQSTAGDPEQLRQASQIWFPLGPTAGMAITRQKADDINFSQKQALQINQRSWDFSEKLLLAAPAYGPHNTRAWRKTRLPEFDRASQ